MRDATERRTARHRQHGFIDFENDQREVPEELPVPEPEVSESDAPLVPELVEEPLESPVPLPVPMADDWPLSPDDDAPSCACPALPED